MGPSNCCIRKTIDIPKNQDYKTPNIEGKLDIKEYRLAVALIYCVNGRCKGLKKFLALEYSLIEHQSLGSSFGQNNLSEYFWQEMSYFYQEEIIQPNSDFNVIVAIKIEKYRYYFNVRRKTQSSSFLIDSKYMFHDIEKLTPSEQKNPIFQKQSSNGYNCREGILMDLQWFNSFLNLKGNYFILGDHESVIQLIAFQELADYDIKSMSQPNSDLQNNYQLQFSNHTKYQQYSEQKQQLFRKK